MVLIWPLIVKLQPMLSAQQRPRSTAWRPIPKKPSTRPWHGVRPEMLQGRDPLVPNVVHPLFNRSVYVFSISGQTQDISQLPLGLCIVDLFRTATDVLLDRTTSDAQGNYIFRGVSMPPTQFYMVSYKAGSPDVFGTTYNTIVGV